MKHLIGGKTDIKAKMWPNGETVIWKAKTFKMEPLKPYEEKDEQGFMGRWAEFCMKNPDIAEDVARALGLSTHAIFDKLKGDVLESDGEVVLKPRARKGNTGITSYGARMVRNAAHLLENGAGRFRCVFATTTVPSLPREKLCVLHEKWGEVVERYRLLMTRALKEKGLSGEIVTVTEVQEKRYEKTGLPILHTHSVFVGKTRTGKWAISTECHDDCWFRAMSVAIDIERTEVAYSVNLQRVKKSAAGYLGKYMSKGSKSVARAIADGFAEWLPNHWWNCTRTLSRKVKEQTRNIDFLAEWLESMAEAGGNDVWEWHRTVEIEMFSGDKITIARYGRLNIRQVAEIHAYYAA